MDNLKVFNIQTGDDVVISSSNVSSEMYARWTKNMNKVGGMCIPFNLCFDVKECTDIFLAKILKCEDYLHNRTYLSVDNTFINNFHGHSVGDKFDVIVLLQSIHNNNKDIVVYNIKFYGIGIDEYALVIGDVLSNNKYVDESNGFTVQYYYLNSNRSLNSNRYFVKLTEEYNASFYSGIDMNMMVREYYNSQSPILLLVGPPGTGKSVFTKLMVNDIGKLRPDGSIYYVKDVEVSGMDEFWQQILFYQPSVVVFDDLDAGLAARKTGNTFMDKLISLSDGFLSIKNTKIIITTNSDDIELDKALTRPGRMYDCVKLNVMNYDEVSAVLDVLRVDEDLFYEHLSRINSKKSPLTLAEIFEVVDSINSGATMIKFKGYDKFNKSVGFGSAA